MLGLTSDLSTHCSRNPSPSPRELHFFIDEEAGGLERFSNSSRNLQPGAADLGLDPEFLLTQSLSLNFGACSFQE